MMLLTLFGRSVETDQLVGNPEIWWKVGEIPTRWKCPHDHERMTLARMRIHTSTRHPGCSWCEQEVAIAEELLAAYWDRG